LVPIKRKRKKKVEGVAEAKSKTPRYTNNRFFWKVGFFFHSLHKN
jgi:hypothetical protein